MWKTGKTNNQNSSPIRCRQWHPSQTTLRGANDNIRNEQGATALSWAERSGDMTLVERLKRAGAR